MIQNLAIFLFGPDEAGPLGLSVASLGRAFFSGPEKKVNDTPRFPLS